MILVDSVYDLRVLVLFLIRCKNVLSQSLVLLYSEIYQVNVINALGMAHAKFHV